MAINLTLLPRGEVPIRDDDLGRQRESRWDLARKPGPVERQRRASGAGEILHDVVRWQVCLVAKLDGFRTDESGFKILYGQSLPVRHPVMTECLETLSTVDALPALDIQGDKAP